MGFVICELFANQWEILLFFMDAMHVFLKSIIPKIIVQKCKKQETVQKNARLGMTKN